MNKSEIKAAYKQAKRPMGVYRITTTQNDKQYVGVSKDLPAVLNRHRAELKFGSHRNRELQELWKSSGESAFKFEVLDELEQKEDKQGKPDEELELLAEMWVRKLEESGGSVVRL